MEEISVGKLNKYIEYFPGPQTSMVLSSIVERNTEAQFWVKSQPDDNVVCLLWDKGNNVFYLSGQSVLSEAKKDMISHFQTNIKARAIKEGLSYFKVKTLSSSLENSLTDIFQNIPLHKTKKLFYTFRAAKVKNVPTPRLEGIIYLLIDADFLEKSQFKNNHYVREEVEWMWPSLERFRQKGFGIAAVVDESIVCWCTAEYVSERKCGIGIEVIEEFQNRGVATATVAQFLEHCLKRNILPHWECDRENVGSVRVAERVGFEITEETVFWSGQFGA